MEKEKTKVFLMRQICSNNLDNGLLTVPSMTNSMCLIEDGHFIGDGVLDYLTEHNEFLVVGCLGTQGVGKSMLMSKLCSSNDK